METDQPVYPMDWKSRRPDLPKATRDGEQIRSDLNEFGYAIIPDALTTEEVIALRRRIEEQAAAERDRGIAVRDGYDVRQTQASRGQQAPNQRLFSLINKGEVFLKHITHPVIKEFVPHVLGEEYLLSSLTANIANKGGVPMPLHSDQGYVPEPNPYAVVCNTMWPLTDFTEENGGTRFVPGSHQPGSHPKGAELFETESIGAEAPAGSAIIFDGRLWHGTGANLTDKPRVGLLAYFCRPFIRQQENQCLSLLPEVYKKLNDEERALLGFRVYSTLGGIGGAVHGSIMEREGDRPGEMRPS